MMELITDLLVKHTFPIIMSKKRIRGREILRLLGWTCVYICKSWRIPYLRRRHLTVTCFHQAASVLYRLQLNELLIENYIRTKIRISHFLPSCFLPSCFLSLTMSRSFHATGWRRGHHTLKVNES
jgi:hypothetical protein